MGFPQQPVQSKTLDLKEQHNGQSNVKLYCWKLSFKNTQFPIAAQKRQEYHRTIIEVFESVVVIIG
jgi:hypothetical protein